MMEVLVCDVILLSILDFGWLCVVVVWVKCVISTPKSDDAGKKKGDAR